MLTAQMQRNKRSSYFEMKLAGSSIEKNRVIERLGAALANSINALKQLKSKIISNNDIMELPRLIVDFQKENANFNDLQKSLAEIDEDSTSMDKVRAFNAEFIEHYNPEQIQNKLNAMRDKKIRDNQQSALRLSNNFGSKQAQLQSLQTNLLQQQQRQLHIIQRLVADVRQIAQNTSRMILQQGAKLKIGASSMANANRKFKLGKDNLIDTDKFQQDTNKKLCMFASILTVIVLIIVMILYASHK